MRVALLDMSLELSLSLKQIGALAVAALLVFIGAIMNWVAQNDDAVENNILQNNDDAESAAAYYVFSTWLVVLVATLATALLEHRPVLGDALAMTAIATFFLHWTRLVAVGVPAALATTSLSGMRTVGQILDEITLAKDLEDSFEVLLVGGVLMFLGMGIAVLVPVARIEVANSNAMIKMAVLGAAAFFAFIGVIVLWAKGDISDTVINGQVVDTGALDLTAAALGFFLFAFVGYVTSHRSVAAFGMVIGGPFALLGLAFGLRVASNVTKDDEEGARAGAAFLWFTFILLWVFNLLLYEETHGDEEAVSKPRSEVPAEGSFHTLVAAEPNGEPSGPAAYPPVLDAPTQSNNV